MIVLHRAERADALAGALADVLTAPPADPFATEVVAVPTRGVERWLSQRLASRLGAGAGRRDGVCANVEFPFPGRLTGGAVAAGGGVDPLTDPWRPERMVWPLLAVADAHRRDPALTTLAGHLDGDDDRDGRFPAVRRIADHFDHYAVHRPEMLRTWADGVDGDGRGNDLPVDLRWQPHLWRLLREHIGTPGPAERLPDACARLRDDPAVCDLPDRLALFGLTRLPASQLDVLQALGAHRHVHLFLLHPSPALWDRVAPLATAARPPRRRDDASAGAARHPLLASWGRDAREMQVVLGPRAGDDRLLSHPAEPSTLLGRIQADVRADRPPPGAPVDGAPDRRAPLAPGDRSIEVHACHGRGRQVEVVRDAILHALADDPTLEPRDIVVMCPAVEEVAPLVHAAFARAADMPGTPDLHVRLADRSLRQTNPVLGVVARLLELVRARVTVAEVLDLAAREPVRRRFHLDDDDLARVGRWSTDAGVRWGLDAGHRTPFGLANIDANTWRAGLDRLLAGVAMAETPGRLLAGVLPLDDVDSGAIDLAGRAAELVARLGSALDRLSRTQTVTAWTAAVADSVEALCAVGASDAWQRDELDRMLADVREEASAGDPGCRLTPAEAESLFELRLRGRPTRANFRTGHLTVCTLVPMRSVPHRMVCLLGLDDGTFPRATVRDGDDILSREPHVGDRDARSEDRQLLLDALMAAGERLVVAHTGLDERTNASVPPAVPVGELLDTVDATVTTTDGSPARTAIRVQHPLQPFDPRNFTPGALRRGGPWSFDRAALDGARAMCGERRPRGPFLAGPLPAVTGDVIDLALVERFLARPTATFLRARLGVNPRREEQRGGEDIPVELGALTRWQVGTRLIEAGAAGVDPAAALRAERARGVLPPGRLGESILDRVERLAGGVRDARADLAAGAAVHSHAIEVALPDGRTLLGSASALTEPALVLLTTYSELGAGVRLEAWVHLLALTAAAPQRSWRAAAIGRRKKDRPGALIAHLGPLGATADERRDAALRGLAVLVDMLDRGLREPLPLYPKTSAAYARAVEKGHDTGGAVAEAWVGGWQRPGERDDPAHVHVLGLKASAEALFVEPARPDEAGDGWDARETSRFGRLALRLWDGALGAEREEER